MKRCSSLRRSHRAALRNRRARTRVSTLSEINVTLFDERAFNRRGEEGYRVTFGSAIDQRGIADRR